MKKYLCCVLIFFIISHSKGQDCPNRIGDFIVNETVFSSINRICNCEIDRSSLIKNEGDFLAQYVFPDDINNTWSGSNRVFQLIPDANNIHNRFSDSYASFNPSVRVLFIPNYETDGIYIKNLLLKFYGDTLYYIQASISNDYQTMLEKYNGKGTLISRKITKTLCKNKKIQQNAFNVFSVVYFYSQTDTSIVAKRVLDYGISSNCQIYTKSVIQIFNINTHSKEMNETKNYIKNIIKIKNEQLQAEKKKKMSRF